MLSKNLHNKFVSLCYSIYPKKLTAKLIESDEELLPFLKKNRLDHYFAFANKIDRKLLKDYEQYKKKVVDSLKILKKKLGNTPFIVIKTFSKYPHTTGDLDIIVKGEKIALKYKKLRLPFAFDIGGKISWTNDEEVSKDFIWKNIQNYNFHGIKVFVPNPNLDILIRMAHLPFEQAEIRLGELLHIFNQFRHVDWKLLEKEAKRNGWSKTFVRTKRLFEILHELLFETRDYVRFPYRLSFFHLAQAVIEKKAWKKIVGARYIIKDRLGL